MRTIKQLIVVMFLFLSFQLSIFSLGPDDYLDASDMGEWSKTSNTTPDRASKIFIKASEGIEGPKGLRSILENQSLSSNANVTIILEGNVSRYIVDKTRGPLKIGWKNPPVDHFHNPPKMLPANYRCGSITIRGEISSWLNPEFVKIDGNLVESVFVLENSCNITFADLKIYHASNHAVDIVGESDSNNSRFRFHHCVLADCGDSIINVSKSDIVGDEAKVARNGLVEYCFIGWTDRDPRVTDLPPTSGSAAVPPYPSCQYAQDGCANGIAIDGGVNWIIRNNLFHWCTPRQKDPNNVELKNYGVKIGNKSNNCIVESNRFIMCESAITLGYKNAGGSNDSLVTPDGLFDHIGGGIRNNMIFRRLKIRPYTNPPPDHWAGWVDNFPQIVVFDSPNTQIVNNSIHIWNPDSGELRPAQQDFFPDKAILIRGADSSNIKVVNNIISQGYQIGHDSGATGTFNPNYLEAPLFEPNYSVYKFIPHTGCPPDYCIQPHPWGYSVASILVDMNGDTLSFRRYTTTQNATSDLWPMNMHLKGSEMDPPQLPYGYGPLGPIPDDIKTYIQFDKQEIVDALHAIIDKVNRIDFASLDYDGSTRPAIQCDYGADEWGCNKPKKSDQCDNQNTPISEPEARKKLPIRPLTGIGRPYSTYTQEEYKEDLKKIKEDQKDKGKREPPSAAERDRIARENASKNQTERETGSGPGSERTSLPGTSTNRTRTDNRNTNSSGVGVGE